MAVPVSRGELSVRGRVEYPAFSLDVDLSVGAGELVAIVGPNGSGKTTLLRVVAGLTPLTAGSVTLDGVCVDDPGLGRWKPPEKRAAGFVFQDHRLFPRGDVIANVAFGLRAGGTRAGPARRRALEWLERMGADHLAARSTPTLSAGEAQRVALARALAPEPSILLLDEPFANLDDPTRRWMHLIVTGSDGPDGAEGPPARLVVTHEPTEALTLARRVIVLENGRIVQDDEPDAITARPASEYAAALRGGD